MTKPASDSFTAVRATRNLVCARRAHLVVHAILSTTLCLLAMSPINTLADSVTTTLIILGVNHGGELVDPEQNPGRYRAYFDTVKPDVFLIEREPERAALANWYPFTYEQQDIVVPYARSHHIPVIPVDWFPPDTDSLALGYPSLSITPPFMKRGGGFQDLLEFPAEDQGLGFFFAEEEAFRQKLSKWAYDAKPSGQDFGRRLYLYRTMMIALHVEAAARQFPGKRILLVIGWMHKPDLEGLLAKPQNEDAVPMTLQPSNTFAAADLAESYKYLTATDCSAIYSVNLISGAVPSKYLKLGWLKDISSTCSHLLPAAEYTFFSDILDRVDGSISKQQLVGRLQALFPSVPKGIAFAWDAPLDNGRLETVYDPFGSLDLRQRIMLTIVQLDGTDAGGHFSAAPQDTVLYQSLLDSLSFVKRAQLLGYLAAAGATSPALN